MNPGAVGLKRLTAPGFIVVGGVAMPHLIVSATLFRMWDVRFGGMGQVTDVVAVRDAVRFVVARCVWRRVVLVCGVWCFRHAGVCVCFVGFVGWWLGGWFAWVVLVVYVVLLLPLAGRCLWGAWFCRVCGGGLRTQERVCTTSL
ncbi:hypothetical protein BPORC_1791 [Bifidobacterium porcinum]|nr:hypothetical protein BPORC_1791 [Bifidobacterium porcinum]